MTGRTPREARRAGGVQRTIADVLLVKGELLVPDNDRRRLVEANENEIRGE